jgi:hypothetical protein
MFIGSLKRQKPPWKSTPTASLTAIYGPDWKLSLIHPVSEPCEYDRRTKWMITGTVAFAAATAPMSASIFYRKKTARVHSTADRLTSLAAIPSMAEDFDASQTIINLSVALLLLSSSIFPLWWSSLSETLGDAPSSSAPSSSTSR